MVVFWPLDPSTGEPIVEKPTRVRASGSSLSARLIPGDYLVVAQIEGHGFHEVYRHVPAREEGVPQHGFANQQWTRLTGGAVELPKIQVPAAGMEQGMAKFSGSTGFLMGSDKLTEAPLHRRSVMGFWMDSHEVTYGEFRRVVPELVPPDLVKNKPADDMPMTMVDFNVAVAYAERVGKRLPEEVEYEAAATDYGTKDFPWGNSAEKLGKWKMEPVSVSTADKLSTSPPVQGLYSNVAEWTCTWATLYPKMRKLGFNNPAVQVERIIRGGTLSVLENHPDPSDWQQGPRMRMMLNRSERRPSLGFRCVRSASPRLEANDFSRELPGRGE
jgi:formylglycine-generating enzyme required for sulfatase activity